MKRRLSVAALCCLGSITPALGAVDTSWDWKDCCRNLYFNFTGAGTDYDLDKVKIGLGPNGQQLTLKNAFISAVDIWNTAQTNAAKKWNLKIGQPMDNCPQINVQLGAVELENQPTDANNVPRFKERMKSIGQQAEDPAWQPGGGNGAGPQDALAFFRRNMTGNVATSGAIYFNPQALWGLAGLNSFDPIILALHEIGHAMKLLDLPGTVNMDPWIGSVMTGTFDAGIHQANPVGLDTRLPSAADIADAETACTECVPTPGVLAPALAALGFGTIRRRRAA